MGRLLSKSTKQGPDIASARWRHPTDTHRRPIRDLIAPGRLFRGSFSHACRTGRRAETKGGLVSVGEVVQ